MAVTIVRTSKAGVKVGIVGRGVEVGGTGVKVSGVRVSVALGARGSVSVWVACGTGEMIAGVSTTAWEQAEMRKQRRLKAAKRIVFKDYPNFSG